MNKDFWAVLSDHIPSLSDKNEEEILEKVGQLWSEQSDVADLAIRTCHCGERIDGFYDYVGHLQAMAGRTRTIS